MVRTESSMQHLGDSSNDLLYSRTLSVQCEADASTGPRLAEGLLSSRLLIAIRTPGNQPISDFNFFLLKVRCKPNSWRVSLAIWLRKIEYNIELSCHPESEPHASLLWSVPKVPLRTWGTAPTICYVDPAPIWHGFRIVNGSWPHRIGMTVAVKCPQY